MIKLIMIATLLGAALISTSCKAKLDDTPHPKNTSGDSRILNDGSIYIKDTPGAKNQSRLLQNGSVFINTPDL